ncbi:hypothetical protein GCM10010080_19140 [Thermomonas carbonis]|nr:hypothetical protein GCM10010080_19140 [Thermomonas carbonis]
MRSAQAWQHEWREENGDLSLQVALLDSGTAADSSRYLFRAPGQCDFHLDPAARTIGVDALGELAENTLEHLLIDQALPRLLAQLGHFMVHASLAATSTGAVLFLGRSGWGKSTLAGLLHRRGFTALCDDCVLLELREGQVWATPAYPGLRLYEDSIDQVFASPQSLTPVADYSSKQRVIGLPLPTELLAPQRLLAVYLLSDPQQATEAMSIEPLTCAAACMALVEHSFRLDPTAREQTVSHLRQAGAITQAAPAFALRYPHEFAQQERLVNMLGEHLDRIATFPA